MEWGEFMAKDQILIEFKVLADDFKSKMNDMKKSTTDLNREFKLQKEEMKLSGSETDKLKLKTEYLSKRYDEAKERVRLTKEQLEQAKQTYGENSVEVERLEGQLKNAEYQQAKFRNELQLSNEALRMAQNPLVQYGDKLKEVGDKITGFGKGVKDVGSKMTRNFTTPIVSAFGGAIKLSTDLNKEMANIGTLIPGQTERVTELKGAVQDLGIQTGTSTKDISGGMYEVISAFGDTNDTIKITEINAKGARAGLATTSDTIKLSSAVMKGYGDVSAESNKKVLDLSFQVVKLGQTSFPELASSMGKVVPLAESLGLSQEELFNIYATGTGVTGNANEVTTQTRGVLKALMSPTKDMAGLMQELGIENGEAMIKQHGFAGSLDLIKQKADETGQPLQKFIGSIEGQTLALALTGAQSDTYREKLELMKDSSGAMETAFLEQSEGINASGFSMEQAMIKMQVAGQNLGDALIPTVSKIADWIGKLADKIRELSPEQMDMIVKFGLALAVIGPILSVLGSLIMVVGGVTSGLGGLIGGLGKTFVKVQEAGGVMNVLKGGLASVKGAFTALTSTTGLWIMAITAVVIAGIYVYKNWEEIKEKLLALWESIKEFASTIWTGIVETFKNVWAGVSGWFSELWAGIVEVFNTGIEWVSNLISTVWAGIVDIFILAWNTVFIPFRLAWEVIKSIVTSGINLVKGIVVGGMELVRYAFQIAWQVISDFVKPIFDKIKGYVTSGLNAVKSVVSSVMNAIKGVFNIIWGAISTKISTVINKIKATITTVWNGIKSVTSTVWNGIKSVISTVWGAISSTVSNAINKVKSVVSNVWNSIKSTTSSVWNSIKTAIETPINNAKNTVSNVINTIKSTASSGFNAVKSTATSVWNGVKSAIETPINKAKNTVQRAINAIKGFFSNLKIKFPDIKPPKLPKFSLKGKFSLAPPSVPKLSVAWKSQGAIFTKPTVLNGVGVGDGYRGTGSGMEAVLPIDRLAGIIRDILPEQEVYPGMTGATIINFNGNYEFRGEDDIDYFLNESAMRLKRREF